MLWFSVSFFMKCFLTRFSILLLSGPMFSWVTLKRSCLIFTLYCVTHPDALVRTYHRINVTYCDPVSSSLLKSHHFPQSHRRAFVDALPSSHLGFTYFCEKHCLIFLHCSPYCSVVLSEHTYPRAFVMMEYRAERWESAPAWVSRLAFSR